jgi:eukaryotic-like serine/threonine-protein kinase
LGQSKAGMGQVLLPGGARETRAAGDLAGKYRLIAELGQGGMATVYLAVALGDLGFRKLAVVKLLRPELALDEEFVEMFLDEARLCAHLSHPNIVHTYDVGVDESGHLIAMEYLDGVSMRAASAKLGRHGGPFGFALQAKVLLEVLEGLRYAHELKNYDGRSLEIVHRDVTPHNIFITYDGQVKLLDFGIAKAATSSVKTATGVIKGKLTYMAPEQARGDAVDARADLYAVGVMLWEAATGKRRWPTGITEPALFTRLANGELPEPPHGASHGLPVEIDALIMRALAPEPADRYQTAVELRDALDGVLSRMPPVSLRNLGGLLSKTFEADRGRIRDVIEVQFGAIEAGEAPSAPHQLPAVAHPTFVTGSEAYSRPSPDVVVPIDVQEPMSSDRVGGSRSRRITARAPDPVNPWPLRLAIASAITLVATVLVVVVALPRMRSGLAPQPASSASSALATPYASPAPMAGGSGVSMGMPPAASSAAAQPAAPPARVDGKVGHGPAPLAAHVETVRPAASLAVPSPPPAPSDATDSMPLPLHPPLNRPKVQLERDNPWP